ncbi:hypothetical protein OAG06_01845 [Verrucomicrobia bacterium]|nr:hypothetical protein [Verrucomicrobiota bacterium]
MKNNIRRYLACDLGAESGRLIRGILKNGRLFLDEIHRFQNTPVRSGGSLHWDIGSLQDEISVGLKKAGALGESFESISCDSWGGGLRPL